MTSYVFTSSGGVALRVGRQGAGMPLLALHGGYSFRGEIEAILDDVLPEAPAFERWTPDLPGMGESAASSVDGAEQVVDALCDLVDAEFGGQQFVLVGHSLGGFLAHAVAARMPRRVAAMALLCPLPRTLRPEPGAVVRREEGALDGLSDAERDEFEGYFVWHTARMVERYRTAVAPAHGYDDEIVGRIMESADFAIDDAADGIPTLVMLGRRDSLLGYRSQVAESERFSRATLVVVDDAGHALPHEKPALVRTLLQDLFARAEPIAGATPTRLAP